MRAYIEFGLRSFRRATTYRAATIAGMSTNLLFGLIRVMIFTAFCANAKAAPEMPLEQAISYVWLVQVILGLPFWPYFSDIFIADIRSGAVAMQLIRPADCQGCWFSHPFSRLLQMLLMRGMPIGLLAMAFGGMAPPPSWHSAALFPLSVGAGMVLAVALAQFSGATAFWTLDSTGFSSLMAVVATFFSGMLVPIALWPRWLAQIAHWMPFQGLTDTPLSVYLGRYAGAEALRYIGVQLAWALLTLMVARLMIARGSSRLEVQGG